MASSLAPASTSLSCLSSSTDLLNDGPWCGSVSQLRPFLPNLLFISVFQHSSRNVTKTGLLTLSLFVNNLVLSWWMLCCCHCIMARKRSTGRREDKNHNQTAIGSSKNFPIGSASLALFVSHWLVPYGYSYLHDRLEMEVQLPFVNLLDFSLEQSQIQQNTNSATTEREHKQKSLLHTLWSLKFHIHVYECMHAYKWRKHLFIPGQYSLFIYRCFL